MDTKHFLDSVKVSIEGKSAETLSKVLYELAKLIPKQHHKTALELLEFHGGKRAEIEELLESTLCLVKQNHLSEAFKVLKYREGEEASTSYFMSYKAKYPKHNSFQKALRSCI